MLKDEGKFNVHVSAHEESIYIKIRQGDGYNSYSSYIAFIKDPSPFEKFFGATWHSRVIAKVAAFERVCDQLNTDSSAPSRKNIQQKIIDQFTNNGLKDEDE